MAGFAETAVANLTIQTSIGGNAMNAWSKSGVNKYGRCKKVGEGF